MLAAGAAPWIRIKGATETEHGYEITYWKKEGRTIVCLVLNPEIVATQTGGGNSTGLKTKTIRVAISLSGNVHDVRDERNGAAACRRP